MSDLEYTKQNSMIMKKQLYTFPNHMHHTAAPISLTLAVSQTQVMLRDDRYGASASSGASAFASTRYAYSQRDGQAELT